MEVSRLAIAQPDPQQEHHQSLLESARESLNPLFTSMGKGSGSGGFVCSGGRTQHGGSPCHPSLASPGRPPLPTARMLLDSAAASLHAAAAAGVTGQAASQHSQTQAHLSADPMVQGPTAEQAQPRQGRGPRIPWMLGKPRGSASARAAVPSGAMPSVSPRQAPISQQPAAAQVSLSDTAAAAQSCAAATTDGQATSQQPMTPAVLNEQPASVPVGQPAAAQTAPAQLEEVIPLINQLMLNKLTEQLDKLIHNPQALRSLQKQPPHVQQGPPLSTLAGSESAPSQPQAHAQAQPPASACTPQVQQQALLAVAPQSLPLQPSATPPSAQPQQLPPQPQAQQQQQQQQSLPTASQPPLQQPPPAASPPGWRPTRSVETSAAPPRCQSLVGSIADSVQAAGVQPVVSSQQPHSLSSCSHHVLSAQRTVLQMQFNEQQQSSQCELGQQQYSRYPVILQEYNCGMKSSKLPHACFKHSL